jgi:hypothetical protein
MTQLLILAALVVLLVAALQPAHSNRWRPGFSRSSDRDWARLNDELDLLASFDQLPDSRPSEAQSSSQDEDLSQAA